MSPVFKVSDADIVRTAGFDALVSPCGASAVCHGERENVEERHEPDGEGVVPIESC